MSDNSRRWPGIETASGLWFDYTKPKPEAVSLADIATSLSNTCRWRGQTQDYRTSKPVYYSVAEHAVKVADLVRRVGGSELALHALHHDSHEASMGDVPTPLKHLLGDAYTDMTSKIDWAICQKLGLNRSLLEHDMVKSADALALRYEAFLLKPSQGAKLPGWNYTEPLEPPDSWRDYYGWPPEYARELFLLMDCQYRGEIDDAAAR